MPGFEEFDDLLGKLGKHKIGKSCLYINKPTDVDIDVLKTNHSEVSGFINLGWMKNILILRCNSYF